MIWLLSFKEEIRCASFPRLEFLGIFCCECGWLKLAFFLLRYLLGFVISSPFLSFVLQEMLAGPTTSLDQGVVRNVSMVEYHGKALVVKTLLPQDKESHHLKHLEMHQLEVLTLDAVSFLTTRDNNSRWLLICVTLHYYEGTAVGPLAISSNERQDVRSCWNESQECGVFA